MGSRSVCPLEPTLRSLAEFFAPRLQGWWPAGWRLSGRAVATAGDCTMRPTFNRRWPSTCMHSRRLPPKPSRHADALSREDGEGWVLEHVYEDGVWMPGPCLRPILPAAKFVAWARRSVCAAGPQRDIIPIALTGLDQDEFRRGARSDTAGRADVSAGAYHTVPYYDGCRHQLAVGVQ